MAFRRRATHFVLEDPPSRAVVSALDRGVAVSLRAEIEACELALGRLSAWSYGVKRAQRDDSDATTDRIRKRLGLFIDEENGVVDHE